MRQHTKQQFQAMLKVKIKENQRPHTYEYCQPYIVLIPGQILKLILFCTFMRQHVDWRFQNPGFKTSFKAGIKGHML